MARRTKKRELTPREVKLEAEAFSEVCQVLNAQRPEQVKDAQWLEHLQQIRKHLGLRGMRSFLREEARRAAKG